MSQEQRNSWSAGRVVQVGARAPPHPNFSVVLMHVQNAPPAVLHKAVRDACACTLTHPTAIDGAFVLAGELHARTLFCSKAPSRSFVQHEDVSGCWAKSWSMECAALVNC
eukprot:1139568-Pelagomonas_calceolata.AAC.3